MKMLSLTGIVSVAAALLSPAAVADPFALTDDMRCGLGNASGGEVTYFENGKKAGQVKKDDTFDLSVNDVTSGNVSATDCWGPVVKGETYSEYDASGNPWEDGNGAGDDQVDKPIDYPTFPDISPDDQGFFVYSVEEPISEYNGILFERVVKQNNDGSAGETENGYDASIDITNGVGETSGDWAITGDSLIEGGSAPSLLERST
ncbi:hypothetical protein [Congregibacter sp.]|uniref:hypothetical protein n=1 Tax=Congregibacter sp. TaxID=2744308 RepID=UPI003F6BEBCA